MLLNLTHLAFRTWQSSPHISVCNWISLFSSVTGRETRCRGEVGECHNTHLHLIWISCSQNHLVPVFWDKAHVSSKAQGSEAQQRFKRSHSVDTVIQQQSTVLSNCVRVAMRQVQRGHHRAADGHPSPGPHGGGAERGVWGCGGGEHPDCGAVQPEDDGGVCGLQPRRCEQRHFYRGGHWWAGDKDLGCWTPRSSGCSHMNGLKKTSLFHAQLITLWLLQNCMVQLFLFCAAQHVTKPRED